MIKHVAVLDILYQNYLSTGLLLYTVEVRTIASVDFDDFAFVDEEGHTHFHAGFEFSGLEGVSGGVAFETGLSVNNLEFGLHGHFCEEDGFSGSVAHHVHHVAFLHVFHTGDEVVGNDHVVPSFLVEEVILVAFSVGVLELAAFHTHVLECFADVEAAFQNTTAHHVLQGGAHDGVTLAGLYVKKIDAEVEFTVQADAGTLLDVL